MHVFIEHLVNLIVRPKKPITLRTCPRPSRRLDTTIGIPHPDLHEEFWDDDSSAAADRMPQTGCDEPSADRNAGPETSGLTNFPEERKNDAPVHPGQFTLPKKTNDVIAPVVECPSADPAGEVTRKNRLKFIHDLLNAEDSIENILNENQASAVVSKLIVGYIDNVMFLNVAGRIDKDTEFDPVRHRPEAEKEVPRGA